ncbi:hypothetical protein BDV95DRAFT_639535 [Massariosphaeria phaeospora]|uniref:Uncharacterized protein n=1 Tax=Massariosphaeria phaeospora TaxID=100035 RepID=A0A7C8M6J6_9PLEO|nr:hypothetical protein BDV95DRAFT_639535 [Massariosphaeria phaeospora]
MNQPADTSSPTSSSSLTASTKVGESSGPASNNSQSGARNPPTSAPMSVASGIWITDRNDHTEHSEYGIATDTQPIATRQGPSPTPLIHTTQPRSLRLTSESLVDKPPSPSETKHEIAPRYRRLTFWYPKIVSDANFHAGKVDFILADGDKPCLLINSKLFRLWLRTLLAQRSVDELKAAADQEHEQIYDRLRAIEEENQRYGENLDNLYEPHPSRGTGDLEYRRTIREQEEVYIDLINQNNQERVHLEQRDDDIDRQWEQEQRACYALYHQTTPYLDHAFTQIGVIPSLELGDPEAVREPVQVEDSQPRSENNLRDLPENNWNDARGGDKFWTSDKCDCSNRYDRCQCPTADYFDCPDATWNNTVEDYNDLIATYDLEVAHREAEKWYELALQAEREFDAHRARYHTELARYILTEKAKSREDVDFEDEFGAVWLKIGQKVTQEFSKAQDAYYEAREKTVALTTMVDAPPLELAPEEFPQLPLGDNMSDRKRKWVESWLDEEVVQSYPPTVNSAHPDADSLQTDIECGVFVGGVDDVARGSDQNAPTKKCT